jgi:hypothetical protein
MKIAVCISSCSNIMTTAPLSYINIRSIYNNETRFVQLLASIASIRIAISNANIYLLESSVLTNKQRNQLTDINLIDLSTNSVISTQRDSPFKGPVEVLMFIEFLKTVNVTDYDLIFKLSGRYTINNNFNLDRISTTKLTAKYYPQHQIISTVLYSIPKCMLEQYANLLPKLVENLNNKRSSIEAEILDVLTPDVFQFVDTIGVSGLISVSGDVINI